LQKRNKWRIPAWMIFSSVFILVIIILAIPALIKKVTFQRIGQKVYEKYQRKENIPPMKTLTLNTMHIRYQTKPVLLLSLRVSLAIPADNVELYRELLAKKAGLEQVIRKFFQKQDVKKLRKLAFRRKLKQQLIPLLNNLLENGELTGLYYEEFLIS